jgi:serine O-acetyltransferase
MSTIGNTAVVATTSKSPPQYLAMTELVTALVESYQREQRITHVSTAPLPSRDSVIAILKLLREILLPGYFGRQGLKLETLVYHVGDNLATLHARLLEQVENAFRHQAVRGGQEVDDVGERAETATNGLLMSLPQVRALLATDVQATFDGDPAATSLDEIIFSYPGLWGVMIYRLAHELHVRGVPLIPRIMSEYAHSRTGIDIHPGATVGKAFFIDHGTGVVIGETSIIGDHVKIYQGVTLGALSTRGGQALRGVKRHPTIQDHVTIYSGASVLGGDTVIGEGAVINSNVFVTQSVPPHTRVSTKNPELQYRDKKPAEFRQEQAWDYSI